MVFQVERLSTFSTVILIATLNEENGIAPTLTEFKETLEDSTYLVVDGGSTDRTVEIAQRLGAEILVQKGRGKGNAIAEGLSSIKDDPKYVVFTDADLTYPARYVLNMLQILDENPRVGMVTGNRFNHSLTSIAMKKPFHAGNRLVAVAQRILNGVDLDDPLTGLRVMRWEILKDWKPRSTGFDIEAELNHRVERAGYQTVEIPVQYRARLGEKKLKLRHGLTIFRRIVSESLHSNSRHGLV